jgi:two-component system, LytTR family, sensor kinase
VTRLSRRDRLLVFGAWAGLGLVETAKGYLNARMLGRPDDWAGLAVGNMPWWLMWAALTPAVIALARRFRLDQGLGAVAIHALASAMFALAHHLAVGTLFYFTRTQGTQVMIAGELWTMTLALQLWNFFFSFFMLNVVTYWATLGAYYALEFHRRARDGEVRAARLEADLHEARLDALRMELNPHFLFNTLNTIAALVERGQQGPAVAMLARLGELLRTTLEKGSDPEVPLERELEFLEIYLEIVGTRFSDRLSVETAVAPELRGALVPTLILQPLVENAVRHGIARRPGRGRITIGAREVGGGLELTVVDSAETGCHPERTEGSSQTAVDNGVEDPSLPLASLGVPRDDRKLSGIGLDNTRRRLAQLYGAAARLRLDPLPHGEGTIVTVSLPLTHV